MFSVRLGECIGCVSPIQIVIDERGSNQVPAPPLRLPGVGADNNIAVMPGYILLCFGAGAETPAGGTQIFPFGVNIRNGSVRNEAANLELANENTLHK